MTELTRWPHVELWWRRFPLFTVDDDVRFVTGHYRAGGAWTVSRVVYRLTRCTGIFVRFKRDGPVRFLGIMTLTDRSETREPTEAGRALLSQDADNG